MSSKDGSTKPAGPAYAVPTSVLFRRVNDQMVLLNIQSEQYYGLDDVGADIVTRITADPLADALTTLSTDYGVGRDVLDRDVATLVDSLLVAGLLVRVA